MMDLYGHHVVAEDETSMPYGYLSSSRAPPPAMYRHGRHVTSPFPMEQFLEYISYVSSSACMPHDVSQLTFIKEATIHF